MTFAFHKLNGIQGNGQNGTTALCVEIQSGRRVQTTQGMPSILWMINGVSIGCVLDVH